MSKLAAVTLDLRFAPPAIYRTVNVDLALLGLRKQIRSRKSGKVSRMPANFYIGRFGGKWSRKSVADLRDYLRKMIRNALHALGLRGRIFVTVAEQWAWSRRRV